MKSKGRGVISFFSSSNREIAMNTKVFDHDLDNFESAFASLRAQMSLVEDAMNELNQMWEGSANAEFNKQFLTDIDNFEETCNFLEKYMDACERAKKKYVSDENKIYTYIQKIKI